MNSKNEILDFLKANKKLLSEKFGVNRIGLFGSYANDTQSESSDIDILVDMPSSYHAFFGLKRFLENELKREVDLGLEKNLRLLIKDRIIKETIYA